MRLRLILPAAVYAVIIGLSSLPADAFPDTPTGLGLLGHAVEYAALGASLRWALATIRPATAVTVVVVLSPGRRGRSVPVATTGQDP
ncbi:MAG: hypothetical protein KY462_09095 [Actinobacteria bacterium]|nr:hypothetical protein [Actinomycetota bacterium]